jgi:hypothetical protein
MESLRSLNEWRQTKQNGIKQLAISAQGVLNVFSTQQSHIKRFNWIFENGLIITIIKDEIVSLIDFLKSKNLGELPTQPENSLLFFKQPTKDFENVKTFKIKSEIGKIYYDKTNDGFIVVYDSRFKKGKKRFFSNKKYNAKAEVEAKRFLEIREKM